MSTSHERAARAILGRMLMDEGAAAALVRTRRRLAEKGSFEQAYVDAAGQMRRSTPRTWPPHQAAAFLQLHAMTGSGRYAIARVEVGSTPKADAEREANADALVGLSEPFIAELDREQKAADEDGVLHWTQEITATRCTGAVQLMNCGVKDPVVAPVMVQPCSVPLEVGTTMPSRTLLHLVEDGGVARWAYGSTDLFVFLNLHHPTISASVLPELVVRT
jgi:hypothetical protein